MVSLGCLEYLRLCDAPTAESLGCVAGRCAVRVAECFPSPDAPPPDASLDATVADGAFLDAAP